jgi:hypothetical protein
LLSESVREFNFASHSLVAPLFMDEEVFQLVNYAVSIPGKGRGLKILSAGIVMLV